MKRIILLFSLLFSTAFLAMAGDGNVFLQVDKPIYFVTGIPLDRKADANSSDVKFQFSVKMNLWQNIADKGLDIFFNYTQSTVWNFYADSSPFYDNVNMPGIGVSIGNLRFGLEHQSNGRGDEYSRSFNYLYAVYVKDMGDFSVQAKLRAGMGWVNEDKYNMHEFYGYGHLALCYTNPSGIFNAALIINPYDSFRRVTWTAEAYLRLSKATLSPWLFVTLQDGLESMRDFIPGASPRVSMLRFGIALRPKKIIY